MANPFVHLGSEVSETLAEHILKLLQDAAAEYEAGQITAGHYLHKTWKLLQINGELAQTLPPSATIDDLMREVDLVTKRRAEREKSPS